jgi:hypothetical protein
MIDTKHIYIAVIIPNDIKILFSVQFTTNQEHDMNMWVHYLNHRVILDENLTESNQEVQDEYEDDPGNDFCG